MKKPIDSFWDRTNLYNLNANFDELFNVVNALKDMSLSLVNDGKLTDKQFQDLQITLNDLVKKGDLTVNDINYNLGKIGLENLSDDVIQAMAGTAPVNAVAADGSIYTPKLATDSVTTEKTAFVKTGKNIFRKNEIINNKVLSTTTGQLVDTTSFVTGTFEPIQPSAQYTQSYSEVVVFYDINKQFISGLARETPVTPRTFTTPDNAYYLRASIPTGGIKLDSYQIEKGSTSTPFEPYFRYIDYLKPNLTDGAVTDDKVAVNTLSLDKLGFTKTSANKFDKSKASQGYYVYPSTGALFSNSTYFASDYIYIKGATQLTKSNKNNFYAFYDANKNYIANTNTSTSTITVPSNAIYVRFSGLLSAINTDMLVEGASLPSSYVPYQIYIPKAYLESETNDEVIPEFYGKQFLKTFTADFSKALNPSYESRAEIAIIGDSWVQGGEFRQGDRLVLPLRDKLKSIYGDGGIGFVSFQGIFLGAGAVTVTKNGSWVERNKGTDVSGLAIEEVESTSAGDTINVKFGEDIDYYEIHTQSGNTGTWRYNVDGGEWTTVDASQEVTPITMTLGKHTINIEHLTGTTTFIGSYAYKGKKGAVVHKIGNGGSTAKNYVEVDRTNYINQLKRCRANTFMILLGTNDMAQSVPLETYKTQMREFIDRIKTAKPNASIILIAPSGNNLTGKLHTMAEISDAQYSLSKELNIAYVSLYRALGDFAMTNANGLMYSDGVHPNANGGYAISSVVYDRLLRLD